MHARSFFFWLLFVGGLATVYVVAPVNPTTSQIEYDDAYAKSLGYSSLYPVEEELSLDSDVLAEIASDGADELFYEASREPAAKRKKPRRSNGKSPGMRKHPILKKTRMHKGTDYTMKVGTPVRAKQSGRVVKADWGNGFGHVVGIRHKGCTAIYAHLSKILVSPGQQVRSGQLIGKSGSSGLSSGPHLHYETCSQVYTEGEKEIFLDIPGASTVTEYKHARGF